MAGAPDPDATSGGDADSPDGDGARRWKDAAAEADQEMTDEDCSGERGVGGEEEHRDDAEPEASARVRLLSASGEVLGESWAELAGAPDDWARYPLYSPGFVGGVDRSGSGRTVPGETAAASGSKRTGLDRGGMIPPPPATVRRRWGWRYRRDDDAAAATSRRWFRPRPPPRDVAGEVRLRLGWVPSGLAVTIHGCRAGEATAASTGTGLVDGAVLRILASGGGRRRRSVVVRAEPGGGAAIAHPVEVDPDGGAEEEVSADSSGDVFKGAQDDRPASAAGREVVPGAGPGTSETATNNDSESLFFVLDASCLLGYMGGDFVGDDSGSGDGARLILSMAEDDAESNGDPAAAAAAGACDAREGEDDALNPATGAARAELLLFPGAEPARRWVRLTDEAGNAAGEVDLTIAWAVAPPSPALSPSRRPSSSAAATEPGDRTSSADGKAAAAAIAGGDSSSALSNTGGGGGHGAGDRAAVAPSSPGALAILSREATDNGNGNGADGDAAGGDSGAAIAKGAVEKGASARAGAGTGPRSDGGGGVEQFPEPAQVVSRCFSMHASDLVLRVSDLDVAVLVTLAKGFVRVSGRLFGAILWGRRCALLQPCSVSGFGGTVGWQSLSSKLRFVFFFRHLSFRWI